MIHSVWSTVAEEVQRWAENVVCFHFGSEERVFGAVWLDKDASSFSSHTCRSHTE